MSCADFNIVDVIKREIKIYRRERCRVTLRKIIVSDLKMSTLKTYTCRVDEI